MTRDTEDSPSPCHVAFLLVPLLTWTVASYFLSPTDPDVWWHLKMGEVILDTASIPRADIFSFISLGKPMFSHEWLSEAIFALLHRLVGYSGLCAFFGALAAVTMFAVYRTCRLRGVGVLASTLTSIVAMRLVSISAGVRPQMFSVVAMAVLAWTLTLVIRHSARRGLWSLPVLFCLWANLHGGFIIGLITLWITLGASSFSLQGSTLRQLGFTSLACTLATLVTPHGIHTWTYPFEYADLGSASLRYISEWQSPNFHDLTTIVMLLVLLCMCVVGVARPPSSRADIVWILLFTSMALMSSRHIPLFGVAVSPIVSARLISDFPRIRRWLEDFNIRGIGVALCVGIPLTTLASTHVTGSRDVVVQWSREPNDQGLPRGAAAEMLKHIPPGNLLNEYDWGGYLIYKLYPTWKTGVDGRADVHGDNTINHHYQLFNAFPNWQNLADSLKAEYILVRKSGALSLALSKDASWQIVFEGDVEQLFVRRGAQK